MSITPTEIRYRADGSIDTEYYMHLGRKERSEAAHKMAKRMISPSKPVRRSFRPGWPPLLRFG